MVSEAFKEHILTAPVLFIFFLHALRAMFSCAGPAMIAIASWNRKQSSMVNESKPSSLWSPKNIDTNRSKRLSLEEQRKIHSINS